ncbi:hypothetical protein E0Z10_g6380 [Xylaria hypoxylon]|uniref:Uncharacterized protein n=1 Tax=Xylaria hypoxylon TaxID=37992 RepID=A0A4Z0YG85_9PEZI|nr:hypothetical protein E0Z10_g6380 [Xylaria hypoxylon]
MGCNITFEAVDVNTTFIGTEFDLDLQSPPQPLEDTARDTTINGLDEASLVSTDILGYGSLAQTDTYPQLLDRFFSMPLYNASLTDREGRRRVVQDPASTHVLTALLGVTLMLFIVGWAMNPGTDVLPRSPTTIQPTDGKSPEDIISALGGPEARFWIGWGNIPDGEGRLMGGGNEAGVSQFGIFVVDEEETKLK